MATSVAVRSVTLLTGAAPASVRFYDAVLGLKRPSNLTKPPAGGLPLTPGLGLETAARLVIRPSPSTAAADCPEHEGGDALPSQAPAHCRFPYITAAVSNLKTSLKTVRRFGGVAGKRQPVDSVTAGVTGDAPDSGVEQAVVVDPGGHEMVLVHKFSRNPLLSVSLGCRNVDVSRDFYTSCFGLDTPENHAGSAALLGNGSLWTITGLDLQHCDDPVTVPRVVTLAVPDVALCRDAVVRRDTEVLDLHDDAFLCTDPDGYVVAVQALDQVVA